MVPNDVEQSGTRDLRALTIVISSPEKRGGAIRAGLQLGDHLAEIIDADMVKMAGDYDALLADELNLTHGFHTTPTRTIFRDIANLLIDTKENYENTVLWSEFSTPRPLQDYDIVHLHNAVPLGGLIAASIRCQAAGTPYVVTTHGISKIPDLPDSMGMSRVQRFVFEHAFMTPYKYVLKNAHHLFALSELDRKQLQEMFPGSSVSTVPNGVSLNVAGDGEEEDLGLPEEKPILLFVGKILESKGVNDLLDAYQRNDTDCTLVVVGPPAEESLVARLQQFKEEEVRYLGYTNQTVLQALYRRADLFVFPTRSDVFPLVTLEAMAAGTPVVSTEVGGIPEQITKETGVLVPSESPDEIAMSITELLDNDARRDAMSRAAIERVRNEFSWSSVAQKTVGVYEDICR